MISRRRFLAITATGVGAPLPTAAQPAPTLARVGGLATYPRAPRTQGSPNLSVFDEQLKNLGFVEGRDLVIDWRYSSDSDRLRRLADELIALGVQVIFAGDPYALRASRAATATTPIVAYDMESDPVAEGFVVSLARPGGNVTGIFLDQVEISAKQLELLKEMVPRLARVAVLWDSPLAASQFEAVKSAARTLNITVTSVVWRGPAQLPVQFHSAMRDGARGLLVLSSPLINSERPAVVDATLRSHMPSINLFHSFARDGGLLAYGPIQAADYRKAARLVAKILGGARPGDLPIERPDRFELVLNARTAKALGLTVPPSLLMRADQVIE